MSIGNRSLAHARFWRWIGQAALCAALVACSTAPVVPLSDQDRYQAAIADAAVARPAKVYPLMPVPATDPVSVVSWVPARWVPCAGRTPPCEMQIERTPLWVTLSGEVQGKCQQWQLTGAALERRLEQLLGLPPDQPPQYRMTRFAVVEVSGASLQRPCLGVDNSVPAQPRCTVVAPNTPPDALRNFVGQQMASSYVVGNPAGPGYPYTRLGYTYDWGAPVGSPPYGASEFILPVGTTVKVQAMVDTAAYCQP